MRPRQLCSRSCSKCRLDGNQAVKQYKSVPVSACTSGGETITHVSTVGLPREWSRANTSIAVPNRQQSASSGIQLQPAAGRDGSRGLIQVLPQECGGPAVVKQIGADSSCNCNGVVVGAELHPVCKWQAGESPMASGSPLLLSTLMHWPTNGQAHSTTFPQSATSSNSAASGLDSRWWRLSHC